MKKVLLIITLVYSTMLISGGGVIVTQGNCCNGSGGTGVADGVGIYSVTAKNLLSNDNDSTVVDGGIADRNTIKDMRLFEYILARNDTSANLYQSLELGNSKFGIPAIGFFHSKNSGFNFMGGYDDGTKYGASAIVSFNNIGIGGGINLDTNHTDFFYVGNIYDASLTANNNRFTMVQTNKITGDLYCAIAMDNSGKIVHDITMPLTAGGTYPVTQIKQDSASIELFYNPSSNPNYPSTFGGITITPNGNPNTQIRIKNINGEYLLNSAGRHLFTSVAATTASFNGDIEATAFNIISDKRMKENIKPYSDGVDMLLALNPKTFNYTGVLRYDSIPIYDTICKKVKKAYTTQPSKYNKDTTTVVVDECNKVLIGYDVTPIKISSEELHIGLIAQEVEKVVPQLVKTNEETGLKTVNYVELIPALINAIKELNERIKILEK